MESLFQSESQRKTVGISTPALRDLAQEEVDPGWRSKKLVRAIKMMDVLTAGDEQLKEYLKENQAQAAKRVEMAKEDMELAETPEEAAELAPDPLDEQIAQPVPEVGTDSFEDLKAALLQECQNQIAQMKLEIKVKPTMYLSQCCIDGCRIHSIDPGKGVILEHIPAGVSAGDEMLSKATAALQNPNAAYVEVCGDLLRVIDNNGKVKETL